jgi:adenylyltransferase/sulfurtransferase
MPNAFGAPEISVQDVAAKVAANEQFIWLDVREPNELVTASINDERVVNVPLSVINQQRIVALPAAAQEKDAEIVVFCHMGGRSGQVTAWLRGQGWTNVLNMEGGIERWATTIDTKVGRY